MNMPCILFAAGIDWLETLLPVLFVLFWIVSQLFAIFRRIAGNAGPQPPVVLPLPRERVGEPRRPPQPAPQGPDPRDELQRQIEEFLKTATDARRQQADVPREPPPRPKPPTAPRQKQRDTKRLEPVATKPVAPPPTPTPLPPLAPGAERHVGSLEARPTEVARHVQDAFAHKLDHLPPGLGANGRSADAAKHGASLAESLVTAARNPATIRQAILLREILERPVDRW
jgi:hypothetical protein